MWRSSQELEAELKSFPDLSQLDTLHSLSLFWCNAVYPADYRASEDWNSVLMLTPYGEKTLDDLRHSLTETGLEQEDILLAYFAVFFHHDLFFDAGKTDSPKIRQLLEYELLHERIRLPYRYGRLLYDRFNDTYSDTRTDHLMSPDVDRLLQGAPMGVYQVGTLLSGPLGVLDSQEKRWIPPMLSYPLWHCSDTGCNAIHNVRFVPPSIPVVDAFSRIEKSLSDRLGPPSEWWQSLSWIHRGVVSHPSRRLYVDLPLLIADCIIALQRTALVETALLGARGDFLRNVLALPPRRKRDADGSAAEVASRLGPETQLQLLLILSDRDLVTLIDDAVFSNAIRIPLAEIRRPLYMPPRLPQEAGSQLSALGLRSARQDPVVNLTSVIWRAYQRLSHINELEWRVRGDASTSPYEALVAFLRNHGPADSVRDLILASAEITMAVCEDLQVPLKYASGADDQVVDRLLWKLGFNPMQFDDSMSRFKARLSEFNEAVLANTPIDTEDARERIRAAGVNVFVSVEDFTDRLVSYNIWLLSSDHFLTTKFHYSSVAGRRSVAQTLGDSLPSGGVTFSWNISGENPLGTLLRYLRAATDWIQSLPEKDRIHLERPRQDLPHFAYDEHLPFPFRHVALWADSDPGELRRYAEIFGRIVKLIEESELAAVRNGLDHFREGERFPSADKLLACVARLSQALELADLHRFLPKVFWLFGRKGNRFGWVEYEFRDYAGRIVLGYGPQLVSGLDRVLYESACLLAPGNLLGTPSSSLIFRLRENSEFSAYWQDYPRRRRIVAGDGEEMSTNATDPSSIGVGGGETVPA